MPKTAKAVHATQPLQKDQPHEAMIQSGREAMLPYTKEPVKVVRAVVKSDPEFDPNQPQYVCVAKDKTITVPAQELHPIDNEPIPA